MLAGAAAAVARCFKMGSMDLFLRPVARTDLPLFFAHQRDPVASHMAAFGSATPDDRAAFDAHWAHLLGDPNIVVRSIVANAEVLGHVLAFEFMGERELSYWVDRAHWGRGIATAALRCFLREQTHRPLHARAAKDNLASIRVLQRCGFVVCDEGIALAEARGVPTEEFVFRLDGHEALSPHSPHSPHSPNATMKST